MGEACQSEESSAPFPGLLWITAAAEDRCSHLPEKSTGSAAAEGGPRSLLFAAPGGEDVPISA
ncbi:hypothetical protein C6I21_04570 [Alkalicoccus urumqiensis]|uniref:Uncharacterized protein n=1 Tax=Alkalicoccus urumqiensis TaxID=1548213 RepID=A0A2P6MK02_ALKUR|nr:hypothetical protein C6I21_04570 [Alkalicoccus urumqiensis]